MEKTKTENPAVTYGIIGGVTGIIFLLLLYLGGVKWFVSPIAYLGFAIPIVFAVLAGVKQKKLNGGYLDFGKALKTVFLTFVIMAALSTIFNYVLFNFIDVPFREALSQETAQATAKMMEKFGASQADIDKAMANSMSGNNYSLSKIMLGFAFGLVFWFIISLIIAAIIKKKKPAFEESSFNG